MEPTPTACAMDWSIQLEKGLRSQKPGKSIEALEEIGRRLEWWNREPKLTFAEYKIFGLIPGEDKLFLNAIFLRLADAFRSGNKHIKKCVVGIFLRMRSKKRDGEGVLSKEKLENYLELLSRVKEVFDKGDAEEKMLALLLLGCWAYLAKDCPDIRYIVLSSLVGGDVLEVKAALFAAGCLSEMSDDFATVFLEVLRTTVLSQEISKDIKLAGGRAFAKMWCSFSIAEQAYKTGLKLLMDFSDDDFSIIMLISLSRIASRWMLLVPTQIELLTLFQSEDRSLLVQTTSLRCLRFILARGHCKFSSTTGTVQKLFDMLHRSDLQPPLQLECFKILYKILLINFSIIPCMEIPELFQKMFVVVKNMLQSSVLSNRVLAVSVLADLSGKVLGRQDMLSGGSGRILASQVISFVLDQVLSLVTPKADIHQADFALEPEVKRLLKILFHLVGKYSYLHCLVLNNVCSFACNLMKMVDNVMDSEKIDLSNHEITEYVSHGKTQIESKIILSVSKIMSACLENLEYADTETSHALDALKLQVDNGCHCSYIGSYTRLMNFLLLHLLSTFICMQNMAEDLMLPCKSSNLSCVDSILECDKSILGCSKEVLERTNYWCAYKAGKKSACQGAWSTAAFIFEQLMTQVKSPSCCGWLKSLVQFSTSEKQIQLFLLSGQATCIIPGGSDLCEMGVSALRTRSCEYMENLLRGCDGILSAEEILAAPDMGHIFRFQRWFLTLRAKALKKVADMMKLLGSISSIQEGTGSGGQSDGDILLSCTTSWTLGPFIDSCMEVSCHMRKLAEKFDLLLITFMGMDRQSVMSVSALALSCSLMAFTAGFAFLVPGWYSSENCGFSKPGYPEGPLHALLIEDLLGRVKYIDCKTRKNLLFLLKPFRVYNKCSSSRFKTQTCSYDTIVLHKLCEYSVGEIFSLQNEATGMQRDADALYRILNSGSELLMNIISKLMLIPFRTPHHFFRVRSAVSSELFIMNEGGQALDGSSILLGSPLSLSLRFQLKNMRACLSGPPNKVYCILNCKPHSSATNEIGDSKWQAQLRKHEEEIDNIMELNKKLLKYATGSLETQRLDCRRRDNDRLMVTEYVCFELNEGGQGFSTCYLDVSILAVGAYRIKWHSCYIDSGGCYWSLLPVNAGPLITLQG